MPNGWVINMKSIMGVTLSVLSQIASIQKRSLGAMVIILSASKRAASTIADATLRCLIGFMKNTERHIKIMKLRN